MMKATSFSTRPLTMFGPTITVVLAIAGSRRFRISTSPANSRFR